MSIEHRYITCMENLCDACKSRINGIRNERKYIPVVLWSRRNYEFHDVSQRIQSLYNKLGNTAPRGWVSGEKIVGLQIASVSRVRNFSGRIVARSFHNACRSIRCSRVAGRSHMPWKRREPIETVEEDAGGMVASRAGERRRERLASPMGARSFFVMIVILEPDQPRASGPAGRLLLRSISYSSRSRPSGRYATLIPPFAGAIYAYGERRPVVIRYACRAEIARVFVYTGDRHVTSKITLIAHAMWITCAKPTRTPVCWEISAVGCCRGAQIYSLLAGHEWFSRSSTTKVKHNKKFEWSARFCEYAIRYRESEIFLPRGVSVQHNSTRLFCMVNLSVAKRASSADCLLNKWYGL